MLGLQFRELDLEVLGLFLGGGCSICLLPRTFLEFIELFSLFVIVFDYFISLLLNLFNVQFQLLLNADVLTYIGFQLNQHFLVPLGLFVKFLFRTWAFAEVLIATVSFRLQGRLTRLI